MLKQTQSQNSICFIELIWCILKKKKKKKKAKKLPSDVIKQNWIIIFYFNKNAIIDKKVKK